MKFQRALLAVSMAVGLAAPADAASLLLEYSVTAKSGGDYHYDFELILTNADNSWVAGQQWDWITFGDAAPGSSPLADFSNGSSPDPNVAFTSSSGGHNGPTIAYGANSVVLPGWQPTAVGSSLKWSGDSFTFLGAGQLKWTTLVTSTGATRANFDVAQLVPAGGAVPEPATWAMLIAGFGAVGIGMRARRREDSLAAA